MSPIKRRKIDPGSNSFRNAEIEFISAEKSGVPFCEHGPTLLLERLRNGNLERFYACAVCRSRKDCNFFRSYDDERERPTKLEKVNSVKKIMKIKRGLSHKKLYSRLKSFRKNPPAKRMFCTECSSLILKGDEAKKHDFSVDDRLHEVVNGISNKQLREPSRLMKSLQNEKKESQYLFSRDTLAFLEQNIVSKFNFDGVLCLGTPRLKEFLHKKPYRDQVKSFLLDVDYRYAQFWSPRFFAQYNMFNGYFYTKLGENCFRRFLAQIKRLLIVVDPPFGGLIMPLAQTLTKLKVDFMHKGGDCCEIVFVSPYFMEQKICGALSGMTMLDYKVTYDGKIALTPDDGSLIRIFTTLDPSKIELPTDFGYRYCDQCQRYVAPENKHCRICNACSSKDGRPYVHCSKCKKCVKARYKHCPKCDHCHKITTDGEGCRSEMDILCPLCGKGGHGWVKCPLKNRSNGDEKSMKKKKSEGGISGKEKKKKVAMKGESRKRGMKK